MTVAQTTKYVIKYKLNGERRFRVRAAGKRHC
jgi:hypothetical protein